jgi:hypothetical protein
MKEHARHRCPDCGRAGLLPWQDRCPHRRACEARQMLKAGAAVEDAARHAQRLGKR